MSRLCVIAGCDSKHYARGWCEMHYSRVRRHGNPLLVKGSNSPKNTPILERLKNKSEIRDDCWEWHGGRSRNGYGLICCEGKMKGTHRVSWIVHNGPIPGGLYVLHKCDNPCCWRPDHLFLGTQKDNMRDMHEKGRFRPRTSKKSEKI